MEPEFVQGDLMLVDVRAWEIKQIARNDELIVQQSSPSVRQLKRVIGMPGDTIKVIDYQVKPKDVEHCKLPYLVKTTTELMPWEAYGIHAATKVTSDNDWLLGLTDKQYKALRKKEIVRFITKAPALYLESMPFVEQIPGWTGANFGKLVVPGKQRVLKISRSNFPLYLDMVKQEGKMHIDTIIQAVNNGKTIHYQPQFDYYFVMGDNRFASVDSRSYGFICQTDVIGKVKTKLFGSSRIKQSQPLRE